MGIEKLIQKMKAHPEYDQAGMILCHNGVVRSTSRDGRAVTGLSVKVDLEKLQSIVDTRKKDPGIIDILVEINSDQELSVGDDVMFLVVAGDIRENVLATLENTLNAIKTTVTHKTEFFKDS